ncbi:radical SAM protein, partial [Patescibacteria group bacterium]|nr:radical SAM protein [Patescibacteria group bacterium]
NLNCYNYILDEIENLNFKFETIFFHGNGEPLINKNIIEMISLAKERNISKKLILFTNGTLMNSDMFDNLISSGIDEINVSIDTIDPETYKNVKGKNLLCEVLNNIDYGIKKISQNKSQSQNNNTSLIIKACSGGSSSIYGINDNSIKQIIDKYKDIVYNSQYIHIKNSPIVELIDGFIYKKKECHKPCEIPFYMIYIKYDGRVSPCCCDVIDMLNCGKIESG